MVTRAGRFHAWISKWTALSRVEERNRIQYLAHRWQSRFRKYSRDFMLESANKSRSFKGWRKETNSTSCSSIGSKFHAWIGKYRRTFKGWRKKTNSSSCSSIGSLAAISRVEERRRIQHLTHQSAVDLNWKFYILFDLPAYELGSSRIPNKHSFETPFQETEILSWVEASMVNLIILS